jgi:hypothetical protein
MLTDGTRAMGSRGGAGGVTIRSWPPLFFGTRFVFITFVAAISDSIVAPVVAFGLVPALFGFAERSARGLPERIARNSLARPIRRSQSVFQPQDNLGVGVQFQPAQFDLRPKEPLAILSDPLKVAPVRFGDYGHLR